MGFPGASDGKESTYNEGDQGLIPELGRSPGGGHGNPLQYSGLENPHGQRSLAGYSPGGHKESDMTERLSTHMQTRDSRASLAAQTVKNLPAVRRPEFNPWVGKVPWRRAWQPSPVFLPGEVHGQRSLAGYSPWGCKESDRTEGLTCKLINWRCLPWANPSRYVSCTIHRDLEQPC